MVPSARVGPVNGGELQGVGEDPTGSRGRLQRVGATRVWPGSWPLGEMATPAIPIHIHALLSGILPPFSSFLVAVLSHYQIHALHLDPSSLVLLSAFALLWEAFVGVTPFRGIDSPLFLP
ncbi:hypothetical protein D1007_51089 [Hordeum vulgare]|nr:hypothetical protein D1007_51089 [Hordeum vulgare]